MSNFFITDCVERSVDAKVTKSVEQAIETIVIKAPDLRHPGVYNEVPNN
jgi:hypothetical protein